MALFAEDTQANDETILDCVLMSLSLTYRVSKAEVALLELLDMAKVVEAINIVIDTGGWLRLAIKLSSRTA